VSGVPNRARAPHPDRGAFRPVAYPRIDTTGGALYRVDSQKLIELSQSALLKSLIGRRHSSLTRARPWLLRQYPKSDVLLLFVGEIVTRREVTNHDLFGAGGRSVWPRISRKHRKTLSPVSNRGHPRILRNHTQYWTCRHSIANEPDSCDAATGLAHRISLTTKLPQCPTSNLPHPPVSSVPVEMCALSEL
jgi:hypothetical protein